MAEPQLGPSPNAEYRRRSEIVAPPHAGTYRGWATWYEAGDFAHGICYRATKWWARSPTGELISHPDPGSTGDLAWLKAEIDRRESR